MSEAEYLEEIAPMTERDWQAIRARVDARLTEQIERAERRAFGLNTPEDDAEDAREEAAWAARSDDR